MTLRNDKFSTFGGSLTKILYTFLISPFHDMRPNVSSNCSLQTCVTRLLGPVVHCFSGNKYKLSGGRINPLESRWMHLLQEVCCFMEHISHSTARTHVVCGCGCVCVCVISLKESFKIPVKLKQEPTRTSIRATLPDTMTARARYLAVTRSLTFQNSMLNY